MPAEKPTPKPDKKPAEDEKRTRRPALPLSDRSAQIICDAAEYMVVSQAYLKECISATEAQLDGERASISLDGLVALICRRLCEEADQERAAKRESIFAKPGHKPGQSPTKEEPNVNA